MVGISLRNLCRCVSLDRQNKKHKMKRAAASLDSVETSKRVHGGQTQSVSSSTSDHSTPYDGSSSSKSLQFFVRNSGGNNNTYVVHADTDDTVESVHEQIRKKTGMPVLEQGYLVYRGKKLQMDKTLEYYGIRRDSQLQLVGRLRSTEYPNTWKAVDRLVSTVWSLCRGEHHHDEYRFDVIHSVQMFIDSFKMRAENDARVSRHVQIFASAGAAALVMLFVSPIQGNKECAEKAIRLLVNPPEAVKKELHTHFVPIILEFCTLLYTKTSRENPLYISCRKTLLSILEAVHTHRSRCFNHAEGRVIVQGLSMFVSELGRKVVKGLESCITNSPQVAAVPLSDDVSDFVALSSPLCNVIEDGLSGMGHLPLCLIELHPCYTVELGSLYVIFLEMLVKSDECLKIMENRLGSGWSGQYLSILKALNTLSKIYEGAEEKVLSVLRSRQIALNALIRNSRRNDDPLWILEHKDLTSSECRRHLAMMLLPELKDEHLFQMLIDRDKLLAQSFEYLSKADAKHLLAGRLFIEFKNEEATGPGVAREWFCMVCQALCNPRIGLFLACPDDNRRFFPNPASDVDPLHLDYFRFCGRVFALSLVYKVQVGILFDRTFFLQLAGETVSLEDARDADPVFYSSCKKILEMDSDFLDSDALGLTFVTETEKLGCRTTVDLCPGGDSIALNSKNREAYVHLLIQHRFVNSVSDQVKEFAKGFSEILCDTSLLAFFFRSLEHEDLNRMLHGSDKAICVQDWKAHTDYNGYSKTDSQIIWFWKIVEAMSVEQRRVLLYFWTSVKYLPVEGFGGLQSRLYIYATHESHERLPSARTCFYRLCLPRYKSESKLQKSLQIITQEHLSCSFGIP
ncbi:hypothetical protein MKW94_002131 [Papaver nudicaule]|uniref:HECT-type E3 ubiquitin transferase n=1 Tax=Papaver nudicaule TaxID=74823 RepID=A0AA41V3T4_PAPNU|nr:hypothetical protein [Papaver nudicaule]